MYVVHAGHVCVLTYWNGASKTALRWSALSSPAGTPFPHKIDGSQDKARGGSESEAATTAEPYVVNHVVSTSVVFRTNTSAMAT